MDLVKVENVEPSHDRAVQKDRAESLEGTELADERDYPTGPVRSVHPDAAGTDRLDVLGKHEGHGREGSVSVPAFERPVVDPDDAGMRLPEGPPQR